MNRELMEELLHEDESSTLDFKRDPYPIDGATDDQKGELIKDVLAFTNAWRRTEAYILIGVEDVKGGRSNALGITSHVDEAKLQQLVNSKTSRPVNFSYYTFPFEGKQIGVIEIPVQERPVFLQKDFGKLKKQIVYIRRGSSTAIADPDEIARMGAASVSIPITPSLELQFAHPSDNVTIGTSIELESYLLRPPAETNIPQVSGGPLAAITFNLSYYKEFSDFIVQRSILQPLRFALKNTGSVLLQNTHMEINIPKNDRLHIADESDLPYPPSYQAHSINPGIFSNLNQRLDTVVRELESHWGITGRFGGVQPKATIWSDSIYLGATSPLTLPIEAVIYGDNLADPVAIQLSVAIKVEERDITVDELLKIANHYRE